MRGRATGSDSFIVSLSDVARIFALYEEDVRLRLVDQVGMFQARHLQSAPPFQSAHEEQFRVLWLDLPRFFSSDDVKDLAATLSPGQPVYIALYAVAIVFFCFFYTALVFNSRETADNLKKSGAFVPGIRPGEQTARYVDKILMRLTLAGAIYITLVCLLPEFLVLRWNVPFYFGGTSLLIIVVVTMDFMAQVQAYLMSHQYESLLKKTSFKGMGTPTR